MSAPARGPLAVRQGGRRPLRSGTQLEVDGEVRPRFGRAEKLRCRAPVAAAICFSTTGHAA
eukprot:6990269-Lingulodinium_polyedra.AAC.1